MPVRKPRPSGQYGTRPTPSSAHHAGHAGLRVAGPQRVLGLHRCDRVHGMGAAQQAAADLGQAQVADLALGHQLGHRADRLLDLGGLRRPVQVVQVDHLDTEPQQRRLAGPLDEVALTADDAVRLTGRPVDAELGGQLHLRPPARDAPADQDLVVSGAVGVRGVQERHAQVQRPVDSGDRLVPVGGTVLLAHPHAPRPWADTVRPPSLVLRMCSAPWWCWVEFVRGDGVEEIQRRGGGGAPPGLQGGIEALGRGRPGFDGPGDRFQDRSLLPEQVGGVDSGPVQKGELEQRLGADVADVLRGGVQPALRGLAALRGGGVDGPLGSEAGFGALGVISPAWASRPMAGR